MRVAHRVPTEWVLADVRVHAVADGFGHGLVHLWAEDGTLLGTASQSTIVRAWRDDQPLTELEGDVQPTMQVDDVPQRYGITFPFDGIPLLEQREIVRELVDLGYTDLWSAESGGYDAFIPLAVAAQWAPELRLGTAIVPAYTRGAHTLASTVASMCQAAPGRFALGHRHVVDVIVERWNGMKFDKPYQRVRDTIRFLRAALTGEKVDEEYETFTRARLPARHHRSRAAADPRRRAPRGHVAPRRAARATARSSTGCRPTT